MIGSPNSFQWTKGEKFDDLRVFLDLCKEKDSSFNLWILLKVTSSTPCSGTTDGPRTESKLTKCVDLNHAH